MTVEQVLHRLRSLGSKENIDGMKRFNIPSTKAFGVTAAYIRAIAKDIKKDHSLAQQLWKSGYHEGRIIAAMIADPGLANLFLMDQWVNEIENWAQCDCCCAEFFEKTKYAESLPFRWSKSKKEYVKRAGIVMIAEMAVHNKDAEDEFFEQYFPIIIEHSIDDRNFVKKAVNWALRQIGKRNIRLHKKAIAIAKEIQKIPTSSAKWIAADALREFDDKKIISIINRRKR